MVVTTERVGVLLASSGWRPRMLLSTLQCTLHSPAPPQQRIIQSQMSIGPRLRNTRSKQSVLLAYPLNCSKGSRRPGPWACWVWSSMPGSDRDFPPRAPGTGINAAHPFCPGTFSPDQPESRAPAIAILPAHTAPPLAAPYPWHSTGCWPRSPGNIPDLCFGFLQLLAASCWPSEPVRPAQLAETPHFSHCLLVSFLHPLCAFISQWCTEAGASLEMSVGILQLRLGLPWASDMAPT